MRRRVILISLCALACGTLTVPAQADPPGHVRANGPIVFAADKTGSYQLYTVEPDGSHLRQITHLDGDAVNPDWSPDGLRIVFELDTAITARLVTINADGSHLRFIPPSVPPTGAEGQPAFTRDGKHIVFERYDGGANDDLYSEALDGSNLHRITSSAPNFDTDPNVAPDGRSISFVRVSVPEVSQALFTADVNGGHERQITPFSFDVGIKQDWSPDGRRLVFTRTADLPAPGDSANVATIGADGTGLKMLTNYQGGDVNAYAGSYSPDGRWIVYRLASGDNYSLVKVRPDGTHVSTILTVPGLAPRFIDWGSRPSDRSDER